MTTSDQVNFNVLQHQGAQAEDLVLQGALIALAGEAGAGENIAKIAVEMVRYDPFAYFV